ncbi:MAG TPA: hypothetical protein VFQ39_15330, partial [Longimicrobium sp.]|nr:hypothetical protein [Longimicrobium sp.]
MKKLMLQLDALRVESFETGAASRAGTVNGHAVVAIVETDDPFGCLRSIGCQQMVAGPVAIVETDDPRGCMRSIGC